MAVPRMNRSMHFNRLYVGIALALIASGLVAGCHVLEPFDMALLDRQSAYLREHRPRPLANDVAVVGIDESSLARFREPFALWHPHLGKFLRAMALARPSVLGVDIALPDRSYRFLGSQYDVLLLQGLAALRAVAPVVLAQTLDEDGNPRRIFPPYISVAGVEALASVAVCLDSDGTVRRVPGDQRRCPNVISGTTLPAKVAARLGVSRSPAGLVDFTLGDDFGIIPFHEVLDWFDGNDEARLASAFRGRAVVLGMNLPYADRHLMPVALAAGEPGNRRLPGMLFHAQALRSLVYHGLLQPAHNGLVIPLAATGVLFWFGRGGWRKSALLAGFVVSVLALSTVMLWRGIYLPVAAVLASAAGAFSARIGSDAVRTLREKIFLRRTFGSYVSPEVLKEILGGRIRPGLGGVRRHVCVLFSDIRGFTARSEGMAPESVISLLNDYFSVMTATIHRNGGMIDKFIGDGIMALFGVPQPLVCPERSAVQSAQEMLTALQGVNTRLQAAGLDPIRIGIGLHSGEAIVGHVGSESRHEYTAIGDVVNVASRLEGLTKELQCPVICSETVAGACGEALREIGEHSIRGHSALRLYGWMPRNTPPELTASAVAGPEAARGVQR